MSALSSVFNRSNAQRAPVNKTARRRSSSTTAPESNKRLREPLYDMVEATDVATLVCIEVSRCTMLKPNLNLGVFIQTARYSERDLAISDSTLLVSAAILDHIGNREMATKLLSKSSTLSKYYEKMGLNNSEVRELYVTMLFALSPDFVKMLETSIKIAIDRRAAENAKVEEVNPYNTAMASMVTKGSITRGELVKEFSYSPTDEENFSSKRRLSLKSASSSSELVPDDSASAIGMSDVLKPAMRRRPTIRECDLQQYISRRRSGLEQEFGAVFPRSKSPVQAVKHVKGAGLGYDTKSANEASDKINALLGGLSIASYDHKTGTKTTRRPRVEDFLDSESVASTVMRSPPLQKDSIDSNYVIPKIGRPLPTESFLYDDSLVSDATLRPVTNSKASASADSLEELLLDL